MAATPSDAATARSAAASTTAPFPPADTASATAASAEPGPPPDVEVPVSAAAVPPPAVGTSSTYWLTAELVPTVAGVPAEAPGTGLPNGS